MSQLPPNPFGGNPFDPAPAPVQSGGPHPTWVPSGGDEVNTLATLSVIFAFVFAPAGAVLGHLGLSQIARTRQRGRDRALVGATLSYVFITAAVVALVVWATLRDGGSGHPRTVAQPSAPVISSAQPTVTGPAAPVPPAPPPPPTVAPADLAGLLPTLEEIKTVPAFHGQSVDAGWDGDTVVDRSTPPDPIVIKPPRCYEIYGAGDNHSYDATAVRGFHGNSYHAVPGVHSALATETVAGYADAAAAQSALARILADWQSCGGSTFSYSNGAGGGRVATWSVTVPADSGAGITTLTATASPPLRSHVARAIAVKANVVVDVDIAALNDLHPASAIAITRLILDKIPGPR